MTIANRVISQGFNVAGGNDITFNGSVDLLSDAAINVESNNVVTLAGGVGEFVAGVGLTKGGPGILVIGGSSPISGTLTVNQGRGRLRGQGTLPNVSGIVVNAGASLVLDNSAATALGVTGAAIGNRIRNTANITLNGGQVVLIGMRERPTRPMKSWAA